LNRTDTFRRGEYTFRKHAKPSGPPKKKGPNSKLSEKTTQFIRRGGRTTSQRNLRRRPSLKTQIMGNKKNTTKKGREEEKSGCERCEISQKKRRGEAHVGLGRGGWGQCRRKGKVRGDSNRF